jgi:hypothetical protein
MARTAAEAVYTGGVNRLTQPLPQVVGRDGHSSGFSLKGAAARGPSTAGFLPKTCKKKLDLLLFCFVCVGKGSTHKVRAA